MRMSLVNSSQNIQCSPRATFRLAGFAFRVFRKQRSADFPPGTGIDKGEIPLNATEPTGKRLVELVGQKKAVAIAVRNISGRRRWSKLQEWSIAVTLGIGMQPGPPGPNVRSGITIPIESGVEDGIGRARSRSQPGGAGRI
jgi:hypothetical protein